MGGTQEVTAPEPCAVLMEYADDRWRSQIIRGAPVSEVEHWLATLEARPRLPGGASGKPLMWLHVAKCPQQHSDKIIAERSVGILPDVLRALDRTIASQELQKLRRIFEQHGQAFHGTVEFASG